MPDNPKISLRNIAVFTVIISTMIFLTANTLKNKHHQQMTYVNKKISGCFGTITLTGYYDNEFSSVYAEFEKNFTRRREAGASLQITHKGKIVVDLWGGIVDIDKKTPWKKNSTATYTIHKTLNTCGPTCFVDTDNDFSFHYAMNNIDKHDFLIDRNRYLIYALYDSLNAPPLPIEGLINNEHVSVQY